jgi:hypothetical protein
MPSSQQADPLPEKYRFDPNDDFYLAPPMCGLLHYKNGAVLAGILEVLCLIAGVFAFASKASSFII